jgi:hypothetical protein
MACIAHAREDALMTQRSASRTHGNRGREPGALRSIGSLLAARRVGGLAGGRASNGTAPSEELGRELAEIGVRLIDDAYMAWFAAARDCEQALAEWREPTAGTRRDADFRYRAALDREEAAARDLERLSELAKPCRDRLARTDKAVALRSLIKGIARGA